MVSLLQLGVSSGDGLDFLDLLGFLVAGVLVTRHFFFESALLPVATESSLSAHLERLLFSAKAVCLRCLGCLHQSLPPQDPKILCL